MCAFFLLALKKLLHSFNEMIIISTLWKCYWSVYAKCDCIVYEWMWKHPESMFISRFLNAENISLNKCDSKTFQIVGIIVHSTHVYTTDHLNAQCVFFIPFWYSMVKYLGIVYLFMLTYSIWKCTLCMECSINFMQVVWMEDAQAHTLHTATWKKNGEKRAWKMYYVCVSVHIKFTCCRTETWTMATFSTVLLFGCRWNRDGCMVWEWDKRILVTLLSLLIEFYLLLVFIIIIISAAAVGPVAAFAVVQ